MLHAILGALLATAPLAFTSATETAEIEQSHNAISANELMSWYEQQTEMIVLDARSEPYFDGRLLPGAVWISWSTSEETILSTIPDKSTLIVVYCYSAACPASTRLFNKLTEMGYTNVYEYAEGLVDWVERGYPITKQE